MYQSLYRKYRPETFDRIVGQKPIITILRNSIKNGKISHAYMFSGPRGTGKTSTAKILAKTVNCLNIKDGISCEKCANCEEINSGSSVDIIEIDAASNNGVDEIRELRNNINLACSSLRYKVYIIDEVHMLSIGAFNALLKTLEEPPEHVIFVLATTDPQKVPTTIVSRCQCYNFKQISINDIVDNLKYICKEENISISKEILEKIAMISNGGMRDAIGLLEKASLYGDNITLEDFNELCGFVTDDDLEYFVSSLVDYNVDECVSIVDKKYLDGINLTTFFVQSIDMLRSKMFEEIGDESKVKRYSDCIVLLNDIAIQIRLSSNPRGLALATLCRSLLSDVKVDVGTEKSINRDIEKTTTKKVKVTNEIPEESNEIKVEMSSVPEEVVVQTDIVINNTFATASKDKLERLKEKWKTLNSYILDSEHGSNVSFLLDGSICAVGDKNFIYAFHYPSLVNRANDMYSSLMDTLKNLLDIDYDIAFLSDEEWNKEKKKYISKLKSGEKYVWIEAEPRKVEKNKKKKEENDNKDELSPDDIFGQDLVEYE